MSKTQPVRACSSDLWALGPRQAARHREVVEGSSVRAELENQPSPVDVHLPAASSAPSCPHGTPGSSQRLAAAWQGFELRCSERQARLI